MNTNLLPIATNHRGLVTKPIAFTSGQIERRPARRGAALARAFGCARDFLENRFVYAVISARARGLSLGVNMNPDRYCNFDCAYCEVDRKGPVREPDLDVDVMAEELRRTLALVRSGELRDRPGYGGLPPELLQLRHVALSGDGEPTLSPKFAEALEAVIHVRALQGLPCFKIVLLTNGTGLNLPQVQESLKCLTKQDEIWAKLEAGTQSYMEKVNRSQVPLGTVLENLLHLARQRPVVIQGLFPAIHGEGPSPEEIEQYARRLLELKEGGAQISLVQIYSATRPTAHSECGHLPLRSLSGIAQTVRKTTGLNVEVF
jgi:wyosine [tRNA(Phe)-imidazoG37] synthetase (radical SAM superfamily)